MIELLETESGRRFEEIADSTAKVLQASKEEMEKLKSDLVAAQAELAVNMAFKDQVQYYL